MFTYEIQTEKCRVFRMDNRPHPAGRICGLKCVFRHAILSFVNEDVGILYVKTFHGIYKGFAVNKDVGILDVKIVYGIYKELLSMKTRGSLM